MENDTGFWILVALMIGIPWATWHYDYNPFSNEVYAYQQIKDCSKSNESKHCDWVNFRKTTYSITPETQTVLYWTDNAPWPINRLTNCNVASKQHWNCGSTYSREGFNDGKFSGTTLPNFRYVSKTEWWLNKI